MCEAFHKLHGLDGRLQRQGPDLVSHFGMSPSDNQHWYVMMVAKFAEPMATYRIAERVIRSHFEYKQEQSE